MIVLFLCFLELTYLNLRRALISSFKDVVGIAGHLKFLEVLNMRFVVPILSTIFLVIFE